MKKVLNVGGNNKAIPLPPQYADFEHILLDIDPTGLPDIVCDARELNQLEQAQFDAIYCSHNLEHYYWHDVPKVLAGFLHVLKEGGFAQIRVPDIEDLMKIVVEKGMDIDDVLYQSPAGPIKVIDVLYGFTKQIERSGVDFYAHKTGFTKKSLQNVLAQAGFSSVYFSIGNIEIRAIAFKGQPDENCRKLFGLS
ncbi:MAG: class I SAM-dependent methyltransferase [Methylotenera sp.]|nr:class I SAM-dependent methyltransferase [Methylotenera sp.]